MFNFWQDGKTAPDARIGRFLLNAVQGVATIKPEEFEKQFSSHLNDALVVMYLSSLTKAQIAIAEKLPRLP